MLQKISDWFFSKGDTTTLVVGSRIKTKWGRGTISGGALNVTLDKAPSWAQHPNSKNVTVNISNIKEDRNA